MSDLAGITPFVPIVHQSAIMEGKSTMSQINRINGVRHINAVNARYAANVRMANIVRIARLCTCVWYCGRIEAESADCPIHN